MKVLYKDEEQSLCVMEVTKAAYIPDEHALQICGPEEDIGVKMTCKDAEKIIAALYQEGKADVTAYPYYEIDLYEDEDDFEDEDDDVLGHLLDIEDEEGFRTPHRIAFPHKHK